MLSGLTKGVGLGALAMYYFDPIAGRRRRSLLQNQFNGTCNDIQDFVDRGWRDLTNRIEGFTASRRGAFSKQQAPDDLLTQRVRSTMGRFVSHPAAIHVESHQGRVVLSGPILASEVSDLVGAVKWVPGVQQVENRLDVHGQPDISALQGGQRMNECRSAFFGNWSPARRLVAAGVGLAMIGNCTLRRSAGSTLGGTIGAGLLAGAVTGQSGLRLFQPRPARARHAQPPQHERSGAEHWATEQQGQQPTGEHAPSTAEGPVTTAEAGSVTEPLPTHPTVPLI